MLNSWFEDFVDEETGEVVSIERNEIILDRDIIIDKENIFLLFYNINIRHNRTTINFRYEIA